MADSFSEKQLERYYRREPQTTETAVLALLHDSKQPQMVVYGTRAVNAYLPDWLDRETNDWDIFVDGDPKEAATLLEQKLDKRYGGDYFSVEAALHPGTFRVRSKVTGNVVVDLSMKERTIHFNRIQGINYASLDTLADMAQSALDNPDAAFRHHKDRDTLQRIEVMKQTRKRKSRTRRFIDGSPMLTSMSEIGRKRR